MDFSGISIKLTSYRPLAQGPISADPAYGTTVLGTYTYIIQIVSSHFGFTGGSVA